MFILAGEIAIDRWPDLARSLRSGSALHARLRPNNRSFRRGAQRIARTLSPKFRCSKSAADHSYLCSKDEKRGFGFQNLVQRHPRHRLSIFAGESLRGKRCDHLEFSLVLLPICGIRVGRYVFVLGDLEDMHTDITHFLHVVGSEVSVTAESSI